MTTAVAVAAQTTLTLRQATPGDAQAIHELIALHLDEGRLLPRRLEEIAVHAHRFVIAMDPSTSSGQAQIVGCVDLAPLSGTVAEVRSLVVSGHARSTGVGSRMIDALVARARNAGFERLVAFTHAAPFFVRCGFSIVPHEWVPEKISTDCGTCAQFRRCGQYAVMLPVATHHG